MSSPEHTWSEQELTHWPHNLSDRPPHSSPTPQAKIPVDIVMRVGQKGVKGATGPVGFQVLLSFFPSLSLSFSLSLYLSLSLFLSLSLLFCSLLSGWLLTCLSLCCLCLALFCHALLILAFSCMHHVSASARLFRA